MTTADVIELPVKNKDDVLDKKNIFKIICGASLTDQKIISDFSMLYSLAGADIIDVAPDISAIIGAKEGIQRAKNYYEEYKNRFSFFSVPILMLSVNVLDDPHFKTAYINNEACKLCETCVKECSFTAINKHGDEETIIINEDLCYGCGKCVKSCPNNALYLKENSVDIDTVLTKLIDDSVSGIEIHVGKSTKEDLSKFWQKIINVVGNTTRERLLFSFSLESSLYTNHEFVEYAKHITSMAGKRVILQVDGTPMSGGNQPSSTLQSLAAAQVLLKNNIEAPVILAGGINHFTRQLVNTFKLECSGIAMGTFARKLLWPYLDSLEDKRVFSKAIRITTNLVQGLEF